MQPRTEYLPGVPCWVDLMARDVDAALGFYGGLFGWTFENAAPPDSPGPYCIGSLDGSTVAAVGGPPQEGAPPAWNTYISVESVDRTVEKVRGAGGQVVLEPTDIPDAGRMAVFADPEGATFSAWEARGFIGAEAVNDPGSWVFSDLNTRDPEGAGAFYGSVFGWKVDQLGMGDSSFTIFTLDGYGTYLAERNPELKEWMANDERARKFADTVAFMVDLRSGEHGGDVPPHWGVTFAVDDADGTAARAEELGGTVVVPPFDAEPVRMTVLADPQGAPFIASKYQPSE
jgi:predicted enzyme related to lactoylglutathione lyase